MSTPPETYTLRRAVFVPNSNKPVLVYRSCLPSPVSREASTIFLESHAWGYDGTWDHISWRHFHPNTHECYGESVLPLLLKTFGRRASKHW